MGEKNKNILKKYSKKELKALDDGKLYNLDTHLSRRVWLNEVNKLNEKSMTFVISFNELEAILKEAKQRVKNIKKNKSSKGKKIPILMVASHLTPELTLFLTEREIETLQPILRAV